MDVEVLCPHCKELVKTRQVRAGAMVLCEHCLVIFPVPERTRDRPSPDAQDLLDIDIALHRPAADSGWDVVRIGLTLQLAAMIVLFLATAVCVVDVLSEGPFVMGLFAPRRPVRMLGIFAGGAALACGFIGLCLCCGAPKVRWVRNRARLAVVLLLLAGAGVAATVALPERQQAKSILGALAFVGGFCGALFWIVYLDGVATYFGNHGLAAEASIFIVAAILLPVLNVCCIATLSGPGGLHGLLFLVPVGLYVWLFLLVLRVRETIPR